MSKRLRYAFAITAGPNAGLSIGGWRIWTRNEDTYTTAKQFGGIWKASLHADKSWRVAMTREHQHSGKVPVLTDGHRNAPWEFAPTAFEDGGRLASVIATFRNALIPQHLDSRDFVVEVADRWDRLTAIYVWMTEPGVTFTASNIIGGPLPLSSGRQVWVTFGDEYINPTDPEPTPAGVIIEPQTPEKDGVTAPGFLIRGLNIS
jgi:hypothetical protein